jgi:hypothetical protein
MKFIKVFNTANEPILIPHDEIVMVAGDYIAGREGKFAKIYRKSFAGIQTIHSVDNVERFLRD